MSYHKREFPRQAELNQSLKDHGLERNKPSQLSDAFRLGWQAALALATPAPAQPEAQEDEPVGYLRQIDLPKMFKGAALIVQAQEGEWSVPVYLHPPKVGAAAPAEEAATSGFATRMDLCQSIIDAQGAAPKEKP